MSYPSNFFVPRSRPSFLNDK
jgi:hypothetical protein